MIIAPTRGRRVHALAKAGESLIAIQDECDIHI